MKNMKNMKSGKQIFRRLFVVAIAVMAAAECAGAPQGEGQTTKGVLGAVDYTGLEARLSGVAANTAAKPYKIKVKATNISKTWALMDGALRRAGRYVILDLSDCTADDAKIAGSDSPQGSDMNIIKDNAYVKGIILPSTLKVIGDLAFAGCTGLTSVVIPESVNSIGYDAFSGCTGLTSMTIPKSVMIIADRAFAGCAGLSSVTLPAVMLLIGSAAFDHCTGLTSVTLPGISLGIGDGAFSDCTGLTKVTIPKGIIGQDVFRSCTGLTSVSIPEGVSGIKWSVFEGCTGLTSITVNAKNVDYSSQDGVLFNKDKTSLFYIRKGKPGRIRYQQA